MATETGMAEPRIEDPPDEGLRSFISYMGPA